MMKLDHLTIPVKDWKASRDWYTQVLGLKVEFEVADRNTVAVQDENDFTIFLEQARAPFGAGGLALTFQVAEVHASFEEILRRGGKFVHAPAKVFWGYGGELRDPDGNVVRLWDQKSMKEMG
jgi:catechol 2,3-dioxygenase-like lactoylglutathione lyase family enzyme